MSAPLGARGFRLVEPFVFRNAEANLAHPEPGHQRPDARHQPEFAFAGMADMVVVDTGDRDGRDALRDHLAGMLLGHDVAGGLHADARAVIAPARTDARQHRIEQFFAHPVDQQFAARQDQRGRMVGALGVGPAHPLGQMGKDPGPRPLTLANHCAQPVADIRAEPVVIAMRTFAVACPAEHPVDRLHGPSPTRPQCVRRSTG